MNVMDYYKETYTPKRGEKTIYEVTIKHLLTMTAPYKGKSEPWKGLVYGPDRHADCGLGTIAFCL